MTIIFLLPDDDFFYLFFSEQNARFQTCDDTSCCSFLQWWQNLGGTQQEHCGVHSEGNASGFTFTMLVFFLTSILYSKTTTTLEENLMNQIFFSSFSPTQNVPGSHWDTVWSHQLPTESRPSARQPAFTLQQYWKTSSWGCAATVIENKVTRIART